MPRRDRNSLIVAEMSNSTWRGLHIWGRSARHLRCWRINRHARSPEESLTSSARSRLLDLPLLGPIWSSIFVSYGPVPSVKSIFRHYLVGTLLTVTFVADERDNSDTLSKTEATMSLYTSVCHCGQCWSPWPIVGATSSLLTLAWPVLFGFNPFGTHV